MIDKQLEQFALADDREAVLDKMIPGSEDAFSYRCLHLQNEGRLDEADALIEQAHARGVRQQLLDRLRDRQALLRFESDPARSCARVQERLGLSFTPARARSSEAEEYPSALDPELIDREYLTPHMLQARDLSWISDEGIAWVLERYAAETRATKLLGRVQQPDHPRLVDEILRGLDSDRRTTFGGLEIHKNLCWAQYRELVHRRPLLLQEEAFVSACLHRLAPPEGCELARDREARGAYHERLWSLVSGLAPKFEPLKKHVLYYMLEHGRAGGEYDRARFLEYLALAGDARFAKTKTEVRGRVSASSFTRELVEMPAVTSDEPLVRDFLITLLRDAEDYQAFAELVREDFLRRAFAEAKILYGAADVERAYALLDSGARKELVDRVELEFAETTPRYFELDEGAGVLALELDVKNVQTLVVKVFEINLFNYFAAHGRDVDTSIDLDGLVATSEQTYRYDEPSQRRARRRFEFPQLAGPGVYVVEFIGGGKSSRALIRRGRLRFTHRLSAAGHALQVVDAAGQVRADATMWLSGREYKPDEDGQIFVPFAADRGGQRRFLLRLGEVITVESFTLLTEAYAFSAAIHVEREALIAGQRAEVVVRPQLRVHGEPVSVSLIKRARLRIESTDLHGVSTSMEVGRFPLHDHQESVHSFQVPEGLRSLCFTVLGAVHNRARGQDVDVSATATVRVNGIDSMTQVASLHLARGQGGYVLHALGKAGEPRAAQRLTVTFHHRLFSRTIAETLQTDARGQVELGALVDILKLDVRAPTGIAGGTWTLPVDRCSLPELVHARAGETISLSRPADVPTTREGYSLLMVRRGQPLRDCFEQLVFPERGAARGTVQLQDLEPGRYELRYKRSGQLVQIVVAEGEHVRGAAQRWIDAGARLLEAWRNRPLSLARVSVDAERDELQIHVVGPKYRPRVHLLASRFVADRPGERALAPSRELAGVAGQLEFPSPRSEFQAGRDIGDEYRYILERRSAQRRYPGNLLARPQLLLDPWAVRGTDTQVAAAASGSAYASGAASPMRSTSRMMRREDRAAAPRDASATLDFLARPGLALYNLRPGDDGVVRVPLDQLAGVHELRVVVVGRDGDALVHHAHAPHAALELRERRLLPGFDPAQHLAQRREATALRPGEALTVDDLSLATVERYDTLARAFELLATLGSGRVTLEKFRFILDWPALTPEERRERYSEYACHELNLLLARKDPAFFAEVIRPHLEHKREREFIDDYLLEADLSPYRESWAYARLNAVERILLAGRLGGALAEATRRD
ncbi:MAG: hypothetical protein KC468_29890, partial [Myxococcales bacterium]|nr:hypothetical protein [Myxococcales bacterium]